MAILAENNGGGNFERELIPAGIQVARCYSMIEIGTVAETWEGQSKLSKKVRLTFELPNEMRVFKPENGEQPMSISKTFTLSMHEKAGLRKFLESWRGKTFTEAEALKFDVSKLLGAAGMLTITHTDKEGKTYANIAAVAPVMKGMTCPDQINPSKILSYDAFDWDIYNELPKFLQDQIASTPEYGCIQAELAARQRAGQVAQAPAPTQDELPEELPF
jgi:hypothetical protein